MKRYCFHILFLLLPLFAAAQVVTPTADEVLSRFLTKIDEQTLGAKFTISVPEESEPISYSGRMQMRGEKFRIFMYGNEHAFDGQTYYVYAEDVNELTLSTPTRNELLTVNPFLFARLMQKQTDVRFAPGKKDAKSYVIELVPREGDVGIQKIVIRLRKADLAPQEVTVREDEGQTTILRFTDVTFSSAVPSFKLAVPGAYINDLR